jgi:hypothetical protein
MFEIAFVIRAVVYPSVFQMALNVSRMIDLNPDLVVKNNL